SLSYFFPLLSLYIILLFSPISSLFPYTTLFRSYIPFFWIFIILINDSVMICISNFIDSIIISTRICWIRCLYLFCFSIITNHLIRCTLISSCVCCFIYFSILLFFLFIFCCFFYCLIYIYCVTIYYLF